jgi:uracil-DNA glycosylase
MRTPAPDTLVALLEHDHEELRSRLAEPDEVGMGVSVLATVHPASILRAPDESARALARRQFVEDLRRAVDHPPL